jgi:hypothetical protein
LDEELEAAGLNTKAVGLFGDPPRVCAEGPGSGVAVAIERSSTFEVLGRVRVVEDPNQDVALTEFPARLEFVDAEVVLREGAQAGGLDLNEAVLSVGLERSDVVAIAIRGRGYVLNLVSQILPARLAEALTFTLK